MNSWKKETQDDRLLEPYAYLLSLQEMSGESKGVIQLMAIRTFSLLDLQILCFNLFLSFRSASPNIAILTGKHKKLEKIWNRVYLVLSYFLSLNKSIKEKKKEITNGYY